MRLTGLLTAATKRQTRKTVNERSGTTEFPAAGKGVIQYGLAKLQYSTCLGRVAVPANGSVQEMRDRLPGLAACLDQINVRTMTSSKFFKGISGIQCILSTSFVSTTPPPSSVPSSAHARATSPKGLSLTPMRVVDNRCRRLFHGARQRSGVVEVREPRPLRFPTPSSVYS